MSPLHLKRLALCAALLAGSAQAADEPAPRALTPAQITAVRGISRSVLAAKKSGVEDGTDAELLARLRASLDRLIATGPDPAQRTAITVQDPAGAPPRATPPTNAANTANAALPADAALRAEAHAEALALAAPMHNHAAFIAARAQAAPDADTRSAGLPLGAQRARLFERWAQQLDTALADGNPDGPAQLRALQAQLQSRQRGLSEAPLAHGTPTLQAMPAGFVPAESNTAAAAAARQRRVP